MRLIDIMKKFTDALSSEDIGVKWHLSRIKPLDSLYVILDPADIPA